MTDHRRDSDPRIDEILALQKQHKVDYHADLLPGEAGPLIAEHKAMVPQIERILVILDGVTVVNASGETHRVGGLAVDVASLKTDVGQLKNDSNGGRGFSVRTRDKVITGLIAALPSLILLIAALATGKIQVP